MSSRWQVLLRLVLTRIELSRKCVSRRELRSDRAISLAEALEALLESLPGQPASPIERLNAATRSTAVAMDPCLSKRKRLRYAE